MLFRFHRNGFTIEKSIDLLKRYGPVKPCVSHVRWIAENLLAFPIIGKGRDGESICTAQRNLRLCLTEFENAELKDIRDNIFTFCQLGRNVRRRPVWYQGCEQSSKTVSACKANKEKHSASTVADALFRIIFRLQFWRRAETQVYVVKIPISSIFVKEKRRKPYTDAIWRMTVGIGKRKCGI